MEHLPIPGVTFTTLDRGGDYLAKLQQLAQALDTSITAFNNQIDATQTATQIKAQVQELAQEMVALAQQAVSDAQAISESGLPSQTGKAGAVFITNGATSAWRKTDGTEGAVVNIAAVALLQDKLDDIELFALAGL